MSLKILSCNVRGLADSLKRRQVFHYVRDKKADIVLIQESHSNKVSQKIWRNEWRGKVFFSHGDSNARGVCILLRGGLNAKVLEVKEISVGRILSILLEFEQQRILISNVYAPNEDEVEFMDKMFSENCEIEADHYIVGGDINKTLNNIDRYPTQKHKATKKLRIH